MISGFSAIYFDITINWGSLTLFYTKNIVVGVTQLILLLIANSNLSGWALHFVPGTSLADKHIRIFVNHPVDTKSGPNRTAYRELKWENMSSIKSDSYDNFAEVQLVLAGSFNYFFTIDGT